MPLFLVEATVGSKGTRPTQNTQTATKLGYLITQLKSFQRSNGYLIATPETHFDVVEGKA